MATDGKKTSGIHIPYWESKVSPIHYAPLRENLRADAVIVGGGMAGVTVAYCLAKRGKKVVLVEAKTIGSGETCHTSAHLASALDDRIHKLEQLFGEENTGLAVQSHIPAIDFIEETCRSENIDCDFKRVDAYLFLDPSDKPESLEKELVAAQKTGLGVHKVSDVSGLLLQPRLALQFSNQGQFHPMKYIQGLCEALLRAGGRIYTQTHAQEIGPDGITTDEGFKVWADDIIVATNAPVNSKYVMPLKQFAYRSYMIGALVEKGKLPTALWWDTGNYDISSDNPPYHYVRLDSYNDTHDILLCGGEDHEVGLAESENIPEEKRYDTLETWCRKYFPVGDIVYRWSGQIMEPVDSLAYIGKAPGKHPNVYIATGDSGHGLTHGTIAGLLLADLITGRENAWEKIYSPSRPHIFKRAVSWIKSFVGGTMEYLANKPADTDIENVAELGSGEGTIVKIEGKEYGVYKDDNDDLHVVSATCTHLGCTIKWNNDEKSWDCPCHGSRFGFTGEVLNGPANRALEYHKEKKNLS